MVLNAILAITSAGGPGTLERELSRARPWDLGELAAGRAAVPTVLPAVLGGDGLAEQASMWGDVGRTISPGDPDGRAEQTLEP